MSSVYAEPMTHDMKIGHFRARNKHDLYASAADMTMSQINMKANKLFSSFDSLPGIKNGSHERSRKKYHSKKRGA